MTKFADSCTILQKMWMARAGSFEAGYHYGMNQAEDKLERQRMKIERMELVQRVTRLLPEDGLRDGGSGLFLARLSKPLETRAILRPAFCFVVQGVKSAMLGDEAYRYDPRNYLLFTVDLPLVFSCNDATPEVPYLGFRLDLDPIVVASVIMENGTAVRKSDASVKAIDVNPINADLLNAVLRLIRLLDKPADYKVLSALVIREIIYRLLIGGQGARLSHLMASSAETNRISKAIGHLRENFDQPLRMETIAREFGMSVSGFYQHFKSVTALSPLQFQKQLRLQEARRLMLGEDLDAANAGYRVGYEDPAYFSRDYKKLFGAPPHRDIARLRNSLER